MKHTIKKDKTYPFPIGLVWNAISDQEAITAWFIKADFKAETGYKYKFTHESTTITGEVLVSDPTFDLVYTWIVSGTDTETTVKWHLEETEEGTHLSLEHSGIENYGDQKAADFFTSFSQGWDRCIGELLEYLKNTHAKTEV